MEDIEVRFTKFVEYDWEVHNYVDTSVTKESYDPKLHMIVKPHFKPSSIEGLNYFIFTRLPDVFLTDEFYEVLREN
jgi:hypothetical protein